MLTFLEPPMYADQNIYTSCEDAFTRGGIRPNLNEPIQILLNDGSTTVCTKKQIRKGPESFCPPGTYGIYSKCFSVHHEYVTNEEASRYLNRFATLEYKI